MTLQAVLSGAGFGLGLWLLLTGLRRLPRPDTPSGSGRVMRAVRGRGPIHLAGVLAAAVVVAAATGWLVGGLLAGLAGWALPGMLIGAERARQDRLRRLEAIATWTESLAATLGGAAGLEQTIIATAPTAPAPIRAQVGGLADALQRGTRLPAALRAFAVDLADPIGDTVVAALLLAAREGAGRLAEPLTMLAAAARDDVAAQRRVEKSRAKAATDARLIIATTLAMAVGLVVFNRGFLAPYDSPAGQVVLAVVGTMFAVGFRWLYTLSQHQQPPRILDLDPDREPDQTPTGEAALQEVGRR